MKIPPGFANLSVQLNAKQYGWKDLEPYFLGHGSERWCFRHPEDKTRVIKISLKNRSKQTRRETGYFSFLQKKKIPFTHIPVYYGKLEGKNYLGIEQELIQNPDGSAPELFTEYIQREPGRAEELLRQLYAYLYQYNILPCDLTPDNMVVVTSSAGQQKFMLIEGLGNTCLIPLAQYCKFWGRKKIKNKFEQLLSSAPLKTLFSDKKVVKTW